VVSQLKVNEIIKQSGSSITIGEAGDTITVPSGTLATDFFNSTGFQAYKSGGDQSIDNNTWTTCTFQSTDYNFGTCWNTATGLYTAPSTGYYNFNVSMSLYNPTARNFMVRITRQLSTSAADLKQSRREDGADGKQDLQTVHVNAVMYLTAGQYVAFQGYIEQDSSTDRRILTGQNITYVKGERIA